MSYDENRSIDVICQFKSDGSIIPIKIKLQDDDGENQIYKIYAYKVLVENGSHTLPNGISVGNHIWIYECKIQVFGTEKLIQLMFNTNDGTWKCRAR